MPYPEIYSEGQCLTTNTAYSLTNPLEAEQLLRKVLNEVKPLFYRGNDDLLSNDISSSQPLSPTFFVTLVM